jgi:putative ABC transport system permease protein
VPYLQATAKDNETPSNKMFLFIKTASEPLGLADAVRRTVLSLDPEEPIADIATMQQRLNLSLASQRFRVGLLESFAFVALALAAIGIYGVLSHSVRLRTHEIGIRIAVGANTRDIFKIVVKHALGLGLTGILLGTILGVGAARIVASFIPGTRPGDGTVFLGAVLLVVAVIGAASFAPSLQAARTDPVTVLRTE